ncbi:MAG: filamentous hemagglutinin N-terminal domain-containing protein [Parachlamydiales bacterium]|nr:filamentous hemagglutinin N-terminal domain-containing protein [Parachlamydiales bacterium]
MTFRIFACLALSSLYALPEAPHISSGEASLNLYSPECLEIITSDRTILEWAKFHVGESETTRFLQPNAESTVLNYVLGAETSQILGRLESNGQLVLINPNGILVGREASIHTGSFVASSLDVNRDLYLNKGFLSFESKTIDSLVLCEGKISGCEVFLIGNKVENKGQIFAESKAGLFGGSISLHDLKWRDGIESSTVRHSGSIHATNETILLGDFIHLQEHSNISSDSLEIGGKVRIEGSFVAMDASARISASSNVDGGTVLLLGNQTYFQGSVLAKGGIGKGGFAEISGKEALHFAGTFDGSSQIEKGNLLLDPNDITISAGGTSGGMFPVNGTCFDGTLPLGACHSATSGSQPAVLNVTELANALANNNVTVQTNPATAGGSGDITLSAPLTWMGPTSLTLKAGRNLLIQDSIQAPFPLSSAGDQIILIADSGGTGTGDVVIGFPGQPGTILFQTENGGISMSGANISIGDPTGNAIQINALGPFGTLRMTASSNLQIQPPNVGFPGAIDILSDQGLTINAATFLVQGGGDPGNHVQITALAPLQATITGLAQINGGSGNMTNASVISSGNMVFSAGSLSMLGGTDATGQCEAILQTNASQTVNVADLLQMTGGTTPAQDLAGCYIAAQANQTVNAGRIRMVAGDQQDVSTKITCAGNQVVNCAGNLFLSGILNVLNDQAEIGYGTSQLINAGSITLLGQTILGYDNLLGAGGPQTIHVVTDFVQDAFSNVPPASSLVQSDSGHAQTVIIGGNLTTQGNVGGSASSWNSGDGSLMNVHGNWNMLGNGGAVSYTTGKNSTLIVGNDLTIDSTTSLGSTCNISGDDGYRVTIGNDLIIGNPTSQGQQILTIGNFGSLTVDSNVNITSGSGTTSESRVLTFSNAFIEVGHDFTIQAGSGMTSRGGLDQFIGAGPVGLVQVIVGNDFTVTGGSGDQAWGFIANFSTREIQVGRDFIITGGTGLSGEAFLYSFGFLGQGPDSLSPASVTLHAGRDISISGGNSAMGGAYGYIAGENSPVVLAAGRNVNLTAGSLAANNHAMIGSAWFDLSIFLLPNLADTNLVQISAFGNFTAQNGPTGSIAYLDFVAAGPGLVDPFDRGGLVPNNNGSLIIKTGGDLIVSSGFNASEAPIPYTIHPIIALADHSFTSGEAWTASSNSFLSSTPLALTSPAQISNFRGGFKVDTGSLGTGIAFTSVLGEIHVSSAENFTTFSQANLTIGNSANLNELTLTSIQGNITVDPFHNIFITNGVTTGGNVFMIAQNNIEMSATGFIAAGGSVDLVTDNQAPIRPLIGPGAFLMNSSATITTGSTLRIYTARQPQNSILGLLNANTFTPGALFKDTSTERWCVYYPNPILGSPYTIFYKDCLSILSYQANLIVSEMLSDLHPADEYLGWKERFSWEDEFLFETFYLRRRNLHLINLPKSWTQLTD